MIGFDRELDRLDRNPQKKQLTEDHGFWAAIKAALSNVKYPEEGQLGVNFDVESYETVDRDFQGSWYYRLK